MKILRVEENNVIIVGDVSSFDRYSAELELGTKACGVVSFQGAPVWVRDDEKEALKYVEAEITSLSRGEHANSN